VTDISLLFLASLVVLCLITAAVLWWYVPRARTDKVTCPNCQREIRIMKTLPTVRCSSCKTLLKENGRIMEKEVQGE
jgi:DNA-directed RNA polymerase subunit RPC12/RpoP